MLYATTGKLKAASVCWVPTPPSTAANHLPHPHRVGWVTCSPPYFVLVDVFTSGLRKGHFQHIFGMPQRRHSALTEVAARYESRMDACSCNLQLQDRCRHETWHPRAKATTHSSKQLPEDRFADSWSKPALATIMLAGENTACPRARLTICGPSATQSNTSPIHAHSQHRLPSDVSYVLQVSLQASPEPKPRHCQQSLHHRRFRLY